MSESGGEAAVALVERGRGFVHDPLLHQPYCSLSLSLYTSLISSLVSLESSSLSLSVIPFFFLKKQDVKKCLWLSEINYALTFKPETYHSLLRNKLYTHFRGNCSLCFSLYFWIRDHPVQMMKKCREMKNSSIYNLLNVCKLYVNCHKCTCRAHCCKPLQKSSGGASPRLVAWPSHAKWD